MTTAFQKIGLFNELIGNAAGRSDAQQLRGQVDMITEEFEELQLALYKLEQADWACELDGCNRNQECRQAALVEVRDGIADVLVTTYGLAHRLGVNADKDLDAVHASNMSKFVTGSTTVLGTAALELSQRLNIEVDLKETAPGIWAITSGADQRGSDNKHYPKGKLLKPASYRGPVFD